MFVALLLDIILVLWLSPARAIDLSVCDNDGKTEVPPFAIERDENQCLMIDPGNGGDPVPFQRDSLHETGHPSDTYGYTANCETEGSQEGCTYIVWDTHVDGYLAGPKTKDLWFGGLRSTYILIKDSSWANSWKCDGEHEDYIGFEGPNGIGCPPPPQPEDKGHVDGWQMHRTPVEGGWWVVQDSDLVNTLNATARFTFETAWGGPPNFLFQGFQVNQRPAYGEATDWIQNCIDFGGDGGESYCTVNKFEFNSGHDVGKDEVWIVGWWGSVPLEMGSDHVKTVFIDLGCSKTGCGGTTEYVNGWWWPIDAPNAGPGSCPNGLVLQNPNKSGYSSDYTFCYTSLDEAKSDVSTGTNAAEGDCPAAAGCPHQMPPFAQLSATGWLDDDSDGTPNFKDSCSADSEAPSPYGCNADGDAFGDHCDGDFTGDGVVTSQDGAIMSAALQAGIPDPGVATDMNCDGVITSADSGLFMVIYNGSGVPRPSGL